MVINNPTENDYAIVVRGYPDYVRELVWTREVGESGTEHIQAYVKLQRQQRMSFIKKLFPRGHFKSITKDEYAANTIAYAQKDDATTAGQHRQTFNDPIPNADTLLYGLVTEVLEPQLNDITAMWEKTHERDYYGNGLEYFKKENPVASMAHYTDAAILKLLDEAEHKAVREKAHLEKLLVSPAYNAIKKKWLKDIVVRILTKHYDTQAIPPAQEQVQAEADADSDGSVTDEDTEDGGSVSSEGSGTDEDCGSATDSSAN